MNKTFWSLLACCAVASPASAALIGTSVTGTMTIQNFSENFFDPAVGDVPTTFENTTGIVVPVSGSAGEFAYQSATDLDFADFSDGQLLISMNSSVGSPPVTYTFSDAAFTSLDLVSTSFSGLSYSLSDGLITIKTKRTQAGATYTATFNVGSLSLPPAPGGDPAPAGVPEPATWAMLVSGFGLVGATARRRRRDVVQAV